MRSLFPSSSAPKRPRLSSTFTPTQPCVVAAEQQKKKAVNRLKPSKLTVIIICDCSKGVPRGKYRKELQKCGHISKLEFTRTMSARQVMGVIVRGFQHLQVDRFTFFRCSETKSTVLLPDDNQNPDGSTLIDASQSRKGVIYVTDSTGFEVYILQCGALGR